MKSRVVFMALLCLLLIFTGVYAADNPVPVKVTWPDGSQRTVTYNGAEQWPEPTVEGIVSGDTCTWEVDKFRNAVDNAEVKITFEGEDCVKYDFSSVQPTRFTINPAELSLTWSETTEFLYDREAHNPEITGITGCVVAEQSVCNAGVTVSGAQTDAGKYKAEAVESLDNYKFAADTQTSCDFTITPIPVTLVWNGAGTDDKPIELVFNGKEQSPAVSGVAGIKDGDNCTVQVGGDKKSKVSQGTGTAEASFAEEACNKNYSISNPEQDFKIVPTTVTLTWSDTPLTYNGQPQAPTATYTTLSNKTGTPTVSGAETNAGNGYTATAVTDNSNYKFSNPDQDFSISRASILVTIGGKSEEITYDGKDHTLGYEVKSIQLCESDSVCKPTDLYTEDDFGPKEGVVAELTRKNAYHHFLTLDPDMFEDYTKNGNLNVRFYIAETAKSILLTINPVALAVEWRGADSYVYNGEKQGKDITIKNCVEGEEALCSSLVRVSGPGTDENGKGIIANSAGNQYNVKAEIVYPAETDVKNYVLPDDASVSTSFTITPKPVTLTWGPDIVDGVVELVYNGTWQKPTVSAPADAFVDACRLAELDVSLTNVDQGVKTATATLTGGDYCNQDYTITNPTQDFRIVPFETTVSWTKTGPFTYSATDPQYPEASYLDYKKDSVGASITIKDGKIGKDVGEYTAVASPQDTNHVFTNSNELDYKVLPHTLTLKPNVASKQFGEDDPTPFRYNIFNEKGIDVTASVLEHMTSSTLTRVPGEEAGEYAYTMDSIKLESDYGKNYNLVLDDSVKFEITEGENAMTAYAEALDPTYNGEEQTLITAAKAKGGTVMYFLDGQTPSADLPKATDAGEYDIWYFVKGDGNYGDLGSESDPRGPVKAKINKLTVIVIPDENQEKLYGEPDPDEFTYTLDPASPKPGLTGKLTREPGEAVSGYIIQQGTLSLDRDSEKNFELVFNAEVPVLFWIRKAEAKPESSPVPANNLVYNGLPQNLLSKTGVTSDGQFIYILSDGNRDFSPMTDESPRAKDAMKYTIRYYIAGDANHTDNGSANEPIGTLEVEIAKAPLTAVPNKGQKKAFGDDDPEVFYFHFDGLVNNEGNPEFKGGIVRKSGEDVGTYAYEQGSLALAEPSNYDLSFEDQGVTFEITKAVPTVIKRAVKVEKLVYTGEPQVIIKPAKAQYGTPMYFIEDDDPSEELPSRTDAGTYTVCYYIAGDDSHEDLGSADQPYDCVTNPEIAKASVVVTPDEGQYKFYGEQDPAFTYSFETSVPVTVDPQFTGKLTRENADKEDAGTYNILKGSLDLTENSKKNFEYDPHYHFISGITFEIRKAEAEQEGSPVAAKNLVYNGQAQNLLSRLGESEDGTFIYILEAEDGYSGTRKDGNSPTARDAMKYTISYYIAGDENHSDKGSKKEPLGTLEVTIAKAPLTAVPNEDQKKTYGDKDPKVFYFHFDGLVNGEGNPRFSGGIVRDPGENVGLYGYEQGTLALAEPSNYDLTFNDDGIKFEITKAPAKVTREPKAIDGLTYNGAPQDLLIPGEAEGGTIMYFFNGYKPSETPPQGTDAGDYPVYWYVKGDDNHSDLLPDNDSLRYRGVTATIARNRVKVTPDEGQFKYFGDKDPVFTYTYETAVPSSVAPEFTGRLDRPAGEGVAFYNIMQGSLDLTQRSQTNFEYDRENDFTSGVQFEIRGVKAELVTEPAAAQNLTYNGTAQNLLSRLATANGGQVIYILESDNGYEGVMTDESPRAKDAMMYTIKYYIKGDANHSDNGSEAEPMGTLEVTIAKAPLKINPDSGLFKIVGEPDPQLSYMRDRASMFGDDNPIPTGSLEREPGEDVGTYKISQGSLTLEDTPAVNKNYYIVVTEGVTFEIKPYQGEVAVVLQANKETREYTGQEISIHAYSIKSVSYPAYTNNDFTCTTMDVKGTNVGEYTKDLSGDVSTICRNTSRNFISDKVSFSFEGDTQAKLTIVKSHITEDDYTRPVPAAEATGVELVYNAHPQLLIVPGETSKGTFMYGIDPNVETVTKSLAETSFSPTIPARTDVGGYLIYYYIDGGANYESLGSPEEPAGVLLSAIYPKEITEDMVEIVDGSFDGREKSVSIRVTLNGVDMTGNYEVSGDTRGTEPGTYRVTVTGINNLTGSLTLTWRISQTVNVVDMFRIGQPEEVCLRCGILGSELPATGLPTRVDVPLAVRPEGLNYTNLNMRIQIPTLDVDVELAGVPTMDGAWKVEWLADRAGLLSGTALPGDGYSIVAAHNTLNAEDYGPFALLSTLENNDTIFVNAPDGSLKLFRVYANELMAPNDMEKLASIAEQEMNTLVLVTCENESVDGGYLNRRVVFAKPLN